MFLLFSTVSRAGRSVDSVVSYVLTSYVTWASMF